MKRKGKPRRLFRRLVVLSVILVVVLGALFGLAYINLNAEQLKRRVVETLGGIFQDRCKFSVGEVTYGLTDGFELRGFTLYGPQQFHGKPFVQVRRVVAAPRYGPMLRGDVAFHSVLIDGGEIVLECDKPGQWNCDALFAPEGKGVGGAEKVKPDDGAPRKGDDFAAPPDRIEFRNLSLSFCRSCLAGLSDLPPDDVPDAYLNGVIQGVFKPRVIRFTRPFLADMLKISRDEVPALLVDKERDALKQFSLSATLTHNVLNTVLISGGFSGDLQWMFASLVDCRLDSHLLALLPKPIQARLADYHPQATVTMTVAFLAERGRPPVVQVDGRILQGQLTVPWMDQKLQHIKGAFSFDGRNARVTDLHGRFVEGHLNMEGSLALGEGGRVDRWKMHAEVDRITLDERLTTLLPPETQKLLDRFQVDGQVGCALDLEHDGKALQESGKVFLHSVDFVARELPYPVRGIKGAFSFDGDRLWTASPLEGHNGPTEVKVIGSADLKTGGNLDFTVKLTDVPFNPYLRGCLNAESRSIWDMYRPSGLADVSLALRRGDDGKGLDVVTRVMGKDMAIKYHLFPYEINRIKGFLEFSMDHVEVRDVVGYHKDAFITCPYGYWKMHPGEKERQLHFEFKSGALPIDEDLKRALQDDNRQVMEDFKLAGRVKADVVLFQETAEDEVGVTVEADFLEGRMNYAQFPYPFDIKSGKISINPANIIITDLKAVGEDLTLNCAWGTIEEVGERQKYIFKMDIERLVPAPALINAMPDHVARLLKNLSVQGEFSARNVEVKFDHHKRDLKDFTLFYHSNDLALNNGALDAGMQFRQIMGTGRIIGRASRELPHKVAATVNIKNMRFHRMKFQDVVLEGTYGERHSLIADLAANKQDSGTPPFSRALFVNRVPNHQAARDLLQVYIKQGNVYSGGLQGFIVADVGAVKDVVGQVFVADVDLGKASKDLFKEGRATGKAFVDAEFYGKVGDIQSFQGKGQAYMTQANLIKLPLFLSMFNLLQFQPVKQSYFNKVSIDHFQIEKGHFHAKAWNAIAMKSDALTMYGGGSIGFDLSLDLYLSMPPLGPPIPLVTDVIQLLLDSMLGFHVTGTIDVPKLNYVPFRYILRLFKN